VKEILCVNADDREYFDLLLRNAIEGHIIDQSTGKISCPPISTVTFCDSRDRKRRRLVGEDDDGGDDEVVNDGLTRNSDLNSARHCSLDLRVA
jgi:hypothetical protein